MRRRRRHRGAPAREARASRSATDRLEAGGRVNRQRWCTSACSGRQRQQRARPARSGGAETIEGRASARTSSVSSAPSASKLAVKNRRVSARGTPAAGQAAARRAPPVTAWLRRWRARPGPRRKRKPRSARAGTGLSTADSGRTPARRWIELRQHLPRRCAGTARGAPATRRRRRRANVHGRGRQSVKSGLLRNRARARSAVDGPRRPAGCASPRGQRAASVRCASSRVVLPPITETDAVRRYAQRAGPAFPGSALRPAASRAGPASPAWAPARAPLQLHAADGGGAVSELSDSVPVVGHARARVTADRVRAPRSAAARQRPRGDAGRWRVKAAAGEGFASAARSQRPAAAHLPEARALRPVPGGTLAAAAPARHRQDPVEHPGQVVPARGVDERARGVSEQQASAATSRQSRTWRASRIGTV